MKAMTFDVPSRRRFLKTATAGALAAGFSGMRSTAGLAQAAPDVSVLAPTAMFLPDLKKIIDTEGQVNLNYGAWISAVDAVSRVTAPSGSRYDLTICNYDLANPIIMNRGVGKELSVGITAKDVPNVIAVNEVSKRALAGRNGEYFQIPLTMGFDTVLYRKDLIDKGETLIDSWGFLFADKYAGKLAWWDSPLNMTLAAGLFLGHKQPDLMDRAELDEVAKFLISKKKNVRTIYGSFAQASNMLANGEVVASYGLVTQRVDLEKKNVPIATAWVKEGVLSLINAAFIPKSTPDPKPAFKVINTMLDKNYANAVARGCGYLSCSKFAAEGFTAEEQKHYGFGVLDGTVAQYPQKLPKEMGRWIELWARVKSA